MVIKFAVKCGEKHWVITVNDGWPQTLNVWMLFSCFNEKNIKADGMLMIV